MAVGFACNCSACRVRSVRWPLLLIGTGALFSADLIWHVWAIWNTWPALLILWGVTGLAARLADDTGHGVAPSSTPFGPPPPSASSVQDAP